MKKIALVSMGFVLMMAAGSSSFAQDGQGKAKWEAKKAEFEKACGADLKAQCSNLPDTAKFREEVRCLKDNENSLSDGCKAELSTLHRHHHKPTS